VQEGAAAHPTDEHFLPLFVALGAAGDAAPARHQPGFAYGGLSMDAYVWRSH
jgi:4,5-DOPA dioxygenase extradiol